MLQYAILILITISFIIPQAFAEIEWLEQDNTLTGPLYDVFFIDENNGWVAGKDGVLSTTDGGNIWVHTHIANNEELQSIYFTDIDHGWAVDNNGNVYDSAEQKWSVKSVIDETLYDVFFINENQGWFVGENGTFYFTTTGGDSWIEMPGSNFEHFYAITFFNTQLGWIVGSEESLLLTTNGGINWNQITIGLAPGATLNDIFFIDENNGWIVGGGGVILYTDNGGNNWTLQPTPTVSVLINVHFIDENNGWAVGKTGIILHTTDGGNTWTEFPSFTSQTLYSIFFIDENNGWAVGDNGVIFTMSGVEEEPEEGSEDDEEPPKKSNGGCADCTPPTLGLDKNFKRVVDDGFVYNGISTQVEKWHTPYPLINATVGEMNLVEIKVYENGGINNMKLVQFGLGAEEIGVPLNSLEVLIEVHLISNGTNTGINVDEIVINDKDNLIDNDTVTAVSYAVTCQDSDGDVLRCVKVDLEYSYREETFNHIMMINVVDKPRNSQNFYFNDGVQVLGDSLNEPPTYKMSNKHLKQQTENLYLTLTRTDKINYIWTDELGVEYLQVSSDRFDRITPHESYQCTDPPLAEINVPTRKNCHFRDLTSLWSYQ